MELTNHQRICMGLEEADPKWDRVDMGRGVVLYFDGDTARKRIEDTEEWYFEVSLRVQTAENRTLILPKTSRGKPRKLTISAIQQAPVEGMYVAWDHGGAFRIGLAHPDDIFYHSRVAGLPALDKDGFWAQARKWEAETGEGELQDVRKFMQKPRKRFSFREGDYFRFRLDRHSFGYCQILMDTARRRKDGMASYGGSFINNLLIVRVMHIVTPERNVPVETLAALGALPSEQVIPYRFANGSMEFVGHGAVPENPDYPILYTRSKDWRDLNRVIFQYGDIRVEYQKPFTLPPHREEGSKVTPLTAHSGDRVARLIEALHTENFGDGFALNGMVRVEKPVLEACAAAGSNAPYWERASAYTQRDLRSPALREKREAILREIWAVDPKSAEKVFARLMGRFPQTEFRP